jgi:hypothetical protein
MSFFTPGRRTDVTPQFVIRTRSGRLVHQPVSLRGDFLATVGGLYNPAGSPPAFPTRQATITKTAIRNEETLRTAAMGPGLPGSYLSPNQLRDVTGRIVGAREAVRATSLAPDASSVADSFMNRGNAALGLDSSAQPTGRSVTPMLTPEEYAAIREGAPDGRIGPRPGDAGPASLWNDGGYRMAPAASSGSMCPPDMSEMQCLWALHHKKLIAGAVGLAAGFGLLLLRGR